MITDIHSHILPGIDDGSDSLDTSIEMLIAAYRGGTETIAATPHCNIPGEFLNYAGPGLEAKFRALNEECKKEGIPIRIVPGMEVFATPDLPTLIQEGKIWPLNHTRYLLLEFSFDEDPAFCNELLENVRKLGITPVIAHPERYFFVQDEPGIAFEWCISGCALQINKGSLLGRFGSRCQRTAERMLQHGIAACAASDAHGTDRRTADLSAIRRYLDDHYGEKYRKLLLEINPERILLGQELFGYTPIPFRD